MDVKGQVVTLVSEEGRHTGRGIRGVVVGEFSEGKEVCPIVLLIRAIVSEVLFQGLVGTF